MAYGVHYRIEYKDCANFDKKIDIEELDYAGAVTDVTAGEDPLNIEMPNLNTVFDSVIALGAVISMISATNMMFLGLFTANPKKFRVRIYEGAATDAFWMGYINPEMLHEPYTKLDDYEVSISLNDGFAVLDRYKYAGGSGSSDSSFDTKWNILQIILGIMGLPYKYLYFACEHVPDGVSIGGTETLFHNLLVDQANYYDESENPMTYLAVLKGLLAPYPLQIRWHDGSLCIYDPSMLADASFSAKRFNAAGTYIDTVTVTRNLDISNEDCEWDGEDQGLDKVAGNSKQKIIFSPYAFEKAVPYVDIQDSTKWTGTPSWQFYNYSPSYYYLQAGLGCQRFQMGANCSFLGKRKDMDSTAEVYFDGIYGAGSGDWFLENTASPIWVSSVLGSSVLFRAKVFIRTKSNEFDPDEESQDVKRLFIKIAVEVAGKRPHLTVPRGPYTWVVSTTDIFYISVGEQGANIADDWKDIEFQFPWNFPGGVVNFIIFDDFKAYDDIFKAWDDTPLSNPTVRDIRFKDIEWAVVDVKDQTSGGRIGMKYEDAQFNDKEYTGKINEDFLSEAPDITLIHSDGINVSDRGALRKADYSYTSGWRKPGDSVSYRLPDILLRTIISQYRESLIKLSGTLTAGTMMTGASCLAFFNTLQDTDFLGSAKLFCMGGVYNDFKRTLNGSFIEIKQDDLTIVIEE